MDESDEMNEASEMDHEPNFSPFNREARDYTAENNGK